MPIQLPTAARSRSRVVRSVRGSVGLPRPAPLRQMVDLYVRDVVFDEPIVTSSGVALGGHHNLPVRRDGSYRYTGHFRATGFPSYEVAILTTLGYSIPVPGSPTPAGAQVAFAAHGQVHGTNEPGDPEHRWDVPGVAPLLAAEWHGVRQARLNHRSNMTRIGSVLLATWSASWRKWWHLAQHSDGRRGDRRCWRGRRSPNLEQFVLPGIVGVVVAGGAAFVLGPSALLPAFVVGAAVTAATVKQSHMTDEQKAFADTVFKGNLPYDRILLTNLVGLSGQPFTTPTPGGTILVNLGKGYDDPVRYTGKGGDRSA